MNHNGCSLPHPPPFRFVRRGRAARKDDEDFDIGSDVDDAELASWLEKPGTSTSWKLVDTEGKKKMTKYLPPGNLQELYQHYAASRELLGVKAASPVSQLIPTH